MHKNLTLLSLVLLTSSAIAAPDLTKLPPPSDKKDLSYAKDIAPLLKDSCYNCHGPERQKGALRLDTLELTLKGGKTGAIVVPGKSEKSSLVISVARIDSHSAMPPMPRRGQAAQADGPKPLTAEQVGLIRAWIDQGAK